MDSTPTTPTAYAHIVLWPDGTPTVSGTRLKVKHVAIEYRYGARPEEIQQKFPTHTLGEIFSALAYYADHKDQIDRQLEEGERVATEHRQAWERSEAAARLQERINTFRQRV